MNARHAVLALITPILLMSAEPKRIGITSSRDLTLDDAIAMALRNNLDVRIERENVSSALQAEAGAHGFYDPAFHWTPRFQVLNTPSPSVLSGEDGRLTEHDHTESFSLRQRVWHGSIFELGFDTTRTSTNNPFIGLSPFYSSQLKLSVTQPLLRGRTIDADRAVLKIRTAQTGIAKTELELRAIDIVTRVEQAYWDIVAARASANVSREAADLARTQLAQNQRMIAAGSLAAIEASASKAELQRRLDYWYSSLDVVTAAENNLKMLLAPHHDDPIWNQEIVPAANQVEVPAAADNLATALTGALQARPELREIGQQQDVNAIEHQQTTDQLRPALNLVASYSNAGLAGTGRTGIPPLPVATIGALPPYQSGGFGTSLSNLFGGRYQSVVAGFDFEWTPRNRQARANLEQTAIAARKLKLQRAQVEQQIEAQVRNALQSLETARQRITAAESGSRAASDKLDSEQRLFADGESTNFLVLTRQNEYSDGKQRLLAARLDFNKAVSRFEEAIGSTLAARKVSLR